MKTETTDVLVIGCGAAGMTAAAVAASKGLKVVVLEKTAVVGGNTSFSGGMVYVPNNSAMEARGTPDNLDDAKKYMDAAVPTENGRDMRLTFLERGREAIDYLDQHTSVKLKPVPFYPDYYPELEGSRDGARVLEPEVFDAACLGKWFKKLRPPIPEFTILGGMMVAREDLPHFRNLYRSPSSFFRVAVLTLQYALQRLRYHRGTRLVLGNGLTGRLLKSVLDLGVDVRTECDVSSLIKDGDRVVGAHVRTADDDSTIIANAAVLLATGGFSQSMEKRKTYLPESVSAHSPFAVGSTGDGLDLGVAAGGEVGDDNTNNAYWSPASVYKRANGRVVVYPHTVTDRGKPGSIVVNLAGRRFTNEAVSYHQFGEALARANDGTPNLPAYIICDSIFIWKYGLGAIIPFTLNLSPFLRAGYLTKAETIRELATQLGIDGDNLTDTVLKFNADAERGEDSEFGRGNNVYSRYLGDLDVTPNPCLAPLSKAPFYAVELVLSDLGTVAGLKVNTDCQAIDSNGDVIPGLYAIGNDMQSIMRGRYPGPGITLGPALTFGYLAANRIVRDSGGAGDRMAPE